MNVNEMKTKLRGYFGDLSNLEHVHALNKFALHQKYENVIEIEVDYNNDRSILSVDTEFFCIDHELIRLEDINDLAEKLIDFANYDTLQEMIKCFDI